MQKLLKNETFLAIFLIFLTTIITYGLSIPKLGYYHDDWFLLWSGAARGCEPQQRAADLRTDRAQRRGIARQSRRHQRDAVERRTHH